ncbi:MAG: DUF5715 family protein [Longimicrobiales bacterium]
MLRVVVAAASACCFLASAAPVSGQSLKGSPWSLTVQNRQARAHDLSYLSNRSHVERFVELGLLVPIRGNANYRVHRVSYPYARAEVKTFVERLAAQYRGACGEQLVVTSLVRPESMRLPNASSRSVHPTGMAIDLRRSTHQKCRLWLESMLLQLESKGVLDATRELRPPHYHVALFPRPYEHYLVALGEALPAPRATLAAARGGEAAVEELSEPLQASLIPHEVLRGETLWRLAKDFGTTVAAIMEANGLGSAAIMPGQMLQIPAAAARSRIAGTTSLEEADVARTYRVSRGDNLWTIAREHRTTIDAIKSANGLSTSRILPGQVLTIPAEVAR